METFKEIIKAAQNAPIWEEGKFLINWANRNASQEDKDAFVEWVDGDMSNVIDVMPNHETTEFFDGAPSWEEIKEILEQ